MWYVLSALLTFTLACLQIQYPAYAITSSEETKPAKNVVTTQIIQEEDLSLDKPESVDQVKATETQETQAIIPQTTTQNETEPLIEPLEVSETTSQTATETVTSDTSDGAIQTSQAPATASTVEDQTQKSLVETAPSDHVCDSCSHTEGVEASMIQPRISHADHASSTTYTYELPDNDLVWDDYHIKKCNYPICYWSDSESHTFRYSALAGNSTYHKRACTKCSFYDTDTARHSYGSYSYYNTSQHRRRCSVCGYYQYTNHGYIQSGGELRCTSCGYTKPYT